MSKKDKNWYQNLKANYRDEFADEPDWDNIQECIKCNLMFDNQEDYDNHMREVHKEIIAYEDEINEDE